MTGRVMKEKFRKVGSGGGMPSVLNACWQPWPPPRARQARARAAFRRLEIAALFFLTRPERACSPSRPLPPLCPRPSPARAGALPNSYPLYPCFSPSLWHTIFSARTCLRGRPRGDAAPDALRLGGLRAGLQGARLLGARGALAGASAARVFATAGHGAAANARPRPPQTVRPPACSPNR